MLKWKRRVKRMALLIIQTELILYGVRLRGYLTVGGEWLILPAIYLLNRLIKGIKADIKNGNLGGGLI